jgi:hypothetical protein
MLIEIVVITIVVIFIFIFVWAVLRKHKKFKRGLDCRVFWTFEDTLNKLFGNCSLLQRFKPKGKQQEICEKCKQKKPRKPYTRTEKVNTPTKLKKRDSRPTTSRNYHKPQ